MTKELLRKGSAKDVYQILDGNEQVTALDFLFSDRVSVFDRGPIPAEFTGLGKLRCAIAGRMFELMTQEGFKTHYISHDVGSATMRVYPLNVAELDINFGSAAIGRLYGTELLFRREVTSGVMDRVRSGKLDRARLERHLAGDCELGAGVRFNLPFCESTTKFEESDRYLCHEEAADIMGESEVRLDIIYETEIREAANFLANLCRSVGYDLRDGKFEGGKISITNQFIFADSISPDELRLVDADGNRCDKDPIRQWYEAEQADWVRRLKAAKARWPNDKSKWPPYEASPPQYLIEEMVDNYRQFGKEIKAI